jgi:hypothetical protein
VVEVSREGGRLWRTAAAVRSLADMALAEGKPAEAAARYAEGLRLAYESGGEREALLCLAGLAAVAAPDNDVERAGRLWGAVEALVEKRVLFLGFERRPYEEAISRIAGRVFDARVRAARGVAIDAVVDYALAPYTDADGPRRPARLDRAPRARG